MGRFLYLVLNKSPKKHKGSGISLPCRYKNLKTRHFYLPLPQFTYSIVASITLEGHHSHRFGLRTNSFHKVLFGFTHPITVTTRIITCSVFNPYKPSFTTVTDWGGRSNKLSSSKRKPTILIKMLGRLPGIVFRQGFPTHPSTRLKPTLVLLAISLSTPSRSRISAIALGSSTCNKMGGFFGTLDISYTLFCC